jgi:hypothetical protein
MPLEMDDGGQLSTAALSVISSMTGSVMLFFVLMIFVLMSTAGAMDGMYPLLMLLCSAL